MHRVVAVLAAAVLAPAACGGGGPPGFPTTTVPTGNLIVNGGAEAGKGSTDGGKVPVPGWEVTGDITVNEYDTPGSSYLRSTDPGPPDRGKNYFAGGPNNAASSATQRIDVVSSRTADVDGGKLRFKLTGWLGGWETQEDNAVLTIAFLDKDGRMLSTAAIGPATAADRQGKTGLVMRGAEGKVPAATRQFQVTLQMTRLAGAYNDGYADSLSLVLGP